MGTFEHTQKYLARFVGLINFNYTVTCHSISAYIIYTNCSSHVCIPSYDQYSVFLIKN